VYGLYLTDHDRVIAALVMFCQFAFHCNYEIIEEWDPILGDAPPSALKLS
jgi:hypothetical protein